MPAFAWPQFDDKQPLADGRSWTARFDSFDEYRDDCYYLVTLWSGDQLLGELMAQVGTHWAGDNFAVPTFEPELKRRIAAVAATGRANTDAQGYGSRT
jgi:hypothetical protein